MAKQLRIAVSNQDPIIITLNDNEAIHVQLQSNALQFVKPPQPLTTIQVSGMRWSDGDFFNFDWGTIELSSGDTVSIQMLEGSVAPTPPRKEEKYVEPEKECSFCRKPASPQAK